MFTCFVLLGAWLCDDSYHAFVMSRNLVEGNGFVYNVGERVNAATNPLFALIIAAFYALHHNMFIVGIFSGVLFSGIAAAISLFIVLKDLKSGILFTALLLISRSFMSYTTSGLENPLLFALFALFIVLLNASSWERKSLRLFLLALVFSLVALTRMDTVLLLVPIVLYVFLWQTRTVSFGKRLFIGLAGLSPFILWCLFSLFYYGFIFPNTAYIKLNTGFPQTDYLIRGLAYFVATLINDPIVILLPILYFILSLLRKSPAHIALSAGCLLYSTYIIWIGGDFMLGRHYTTPYFLSVLGVCQLYPGFKKHPARLPSILVALLLLNVGVYTADIGKQYLLFSELDVDALGLPTTNVADERNSYFNHSSLMAYILSDGPSRIQQTWGIPAVREGGALNFAPGILVYYSYHHIPVFDSFALGDALLARLPAIHSDRWRIGHMVRQIPDGYSETVATGANCIQDPDLHAYYDHLRFVISGDLWDIDRISEIIKINSGAYDSLIDSYLNRVNEPS